MFDPPPLAYIKFNLFLSNSNEIYTETEQKQKPLTMINKVEEDDLDCVDDSKLMKSAVWSEEKQVQSVASGAIYVADDFVFIMVNGQFVSSLLFMLFKHKFV